MSSSIRVGISQVPSIDPGSLDSPDALLVASQVFDGLVAYDPRTLAVVPAAAEEWQILDEGRRFAFLLRDDMRFHDGSPVRAQDFVAAWNRLADPIQSRPYAFLLEAVRGFEQYRLSFGVEPFTGLIAHDDRTLEVRLSHPWPDFLSVLAHPALSPVPPRGAFGTRPIGNGPYLLIEDLSVDAPIQLRRFDRYYGTAPPVEGLEFRQFEQEDSAWPSFLAGELEVAPIPGALVDDAGGRFGEEGIETQTRLLYCGFNLKDERFDDEGLRRAVSLGIDRESLVRSVYGALAEPATGIVPPTIPGHQDDVCQGRCEHDPAAAEALVRESPKKSREFALDYSSSDVATKLAEAIADDLGEIGLKVEPRAHDADGYTTTLERGEQQFFCLVAVGDYPRQQALLEPLFLSTSPDNHTGLKNDEVDMLLEQARADPDPIGREEGYIAAERRTLELMPLVPVAWFRSHLAASPQVQGFRVDPLGLFDAASLSLEG